MHTKLFAHKTVTRTNEAQPPSQFVLSNWQVIHVERDQYGHSWLGCIVGRFHRTSLDAEFHLQAASRAFFVYKHRLCDETVRCE